jgi:Uncharacterized conserved protein (DUF2075)
LLSEPLTSSSENQALKRRFGSRRRHDLRYDFESQTWQGHPADSEDRSVKRAEAYFTRLVKNPYRVLLSRAMKGCFVYFMDKETEKFFRSRTDSNPSFIEIACLSAVLWVVLLSRIAKIFGLPLLGVP